MPEGPEVTTIVEELNELVVGLTIINFILHSVKNKSPVAPLLENDFKKIVVGSKILSVDRKGKNIIVNLDNNVHLVIHLLMTGQLWVQEDLPRFYRLTFELENNKKIHLADRSTWVNVKVLKSNQLPEYLKSLNLGLDALSDDNTLDKFVSLIKSSRPIHTLLLDQKVISGLGNIYVNESLFLAKIRPHRKANSLSEYEIKNLHNVIKNVLSDAIKHKGTTFSDYRTPKGNKGNHQKYLKVFKRANQPCVICCEKIIREKVSGRGVFYCKACQK